MPNGTEQGWMFERKATVTSKEQVLSDKKLHSLNNP